MEDFQTCVDVLDIRFKAGPKIRVFEEWSNFVSPLNLVTSINKHGLLVVGTPHGLVVFKLKDILENADGDVCPRRTIPMENITHLAVNCDDTFLFVVVNSNQTCHGYIIEVKSLVNQKNVSPIGKVALTHQHTQELAWNPALPNYLCVCFTNGSLTMIDIKPQGVITIVNSIATSKATCVSWSPKGKQLVAGSKDGTLIQHTPELKVVKTLPLPANLAAPCEPLSVCWLSSFQFAVVYKIISIEENRLSLCIVDAPKQGPVSCIEYDDICYSSAEFRVNQFYLYILHTWNILMCASANGMEVGVLGQCDVQSNPSKWQQWCMEDSARAELPMEGANETFPIGLAVNTSATERLTWGEETIPAMPVLAVLSQRGFLCVFHVMNLKPQAPIVCSPPVSIPGEIPSLFIETDVLSSLKAIPKIPTAAKVSSSVFHSQPSQSIQTKFMLPPAQPTNQPLASQPTVQIAKPVAQQPSLSLQLIEKPATTTKEHAVLPVLQPTSSILKKAPEKSADIKLSEDITVDLSADAFSNAASNIITIFVEEISSASQRIQEEPSQTNLLSAGEFINKIQEVQDSTLAFRNDLKDTAEKKDMKLQLSHERNHKDYVNIKNKICTRNLSQMAYLNKNQPLNLSTKNTLDAVETRMLYIKTEAHDASKILNKLELGENSRNKYEITDKMALSKSIHVQSQILNELDAKYKYIERSATLDPNIRYHGGANRYMCMKSITEALEKTVSACLHDTVLPLNSNDEAIIAQHSSSEIVPVVAALNEPIISPNKSPFKSILSSMATPWKSPAASSTPTKQKESQNSVITREPKQLFAVETNQNNSFEVNTSMKVSEPVYERVSSVESSETSSTDQDELSNNPLSLLGSAVDKIKPSSNLSSFMVSQKINTVPPPCTKGLIFGGPINLATTTSSIKTTSTFTANKFNTIASTAPFSVTPTTPSFSYLSAAKTSTTEAAPKTIFGSSTFSFTNSPSNTKLGSNIFGTSSANSFGTKTTVSAVTPFKFAANTAVSSEIETVANSTIESENKSLPTVPVIENEPSATSAIKSSSGVSSTTTETIFGGFGSTGTSLFSGKSFTPTKNIEKNCETLSDPLNSSAAISGWNLSKSSSKSSSTSVDTTAAKFSFSSNSSTLGNDVLETTESTNTTAVASLPTLTTTATSFSGKSPCESVVTSTLGDSTVTISPVTSVPFTSHGTLFGKTIAVTSATTTEISTAATAFKTVPITGTGTLFGVSTTTTDSKKVFETPVKTQSAGSVFGSSVAFGNPGSTASSVFGSSVAFDKQNSSVFSVSPTSSDAKSNIPSILGASDNASSSTFKTSKSDNVLEGSEFKSVFGSSGSSFASTTTTTAPSAFSSNLFGQVASADLNTSQVSSIFGGLMSSGENAFQRTSFSKPASSIFGGGTPSSSTQPTENLFGGIQACTPINENKSLIGTASPQNPFAKQSVSTVFGQSPTPSGAFSSPVQNVFGQASSGSFIGGASSGPSPFSSPTTNSGNVFGGSPSFGTTSPGVFGAPPAFGGAPAFGTGRTNVFGNTGNEPATVFGSAVAQSQGSSGFGALASQSTVSFGNLAQQSPTGFAGFGSNQSNNQPQQQQPQQQQSTFGGSSFSSWR